MNKKFIPQNWQAILSDLHQWFGSDYKINKALQELVDVSDGYRGALQQLRNGTAKSQDVTHTVGEAVLYLHTKIKKQNNK